MKTRQITAILIAFFALSSCSTDPQKKKDEGMKTTTDKNGYEYRYLEEDKMDVRIYELKNGLKVYLTKNEEEPRIQTLIAVKAGSTYDPQETTGLAHYLEHMMFKGTSDLGTKNWEKEKPLLDEISSLYEAHKAATTDDEKKNIYTRIDSISQEAAKFAIPNEYDKVVSSMGARVTNAFTSDEETVYMNDIPSNELERWLKLERERFGELVLRLFHTELETVYEEFNRAQDSDYRKSYDAMKQALYPRHPYGQQTTIGKAEHLKNPSMVNIHDYWNEYYRPNNMAIILSGDLDYDETIQMIDEHWSDLEPNKNFPGLNLPKEDPIKEPRVREVVGPDAEFLQMAYRFDGVNSKDEKYVTVIQNLLSNRTAGLVDLNLVQKQKILDASTSSSFNRDYGEMNLFAKARQGQELEEVKDLLLNEIEKIKTGDFEDWLIEAIVNDLKLTEIKRRESNWRVFYILGSFTKGVPWEDKVSFLDEVEKISKKEVVNFAKEQFKDNYVVVYKRNGEDTSAVKVEKPQITPIDINRSDESGFFQKIMAENPPELKPVFVDYEKDLSKKEIKAGLDYYYIENNTNELFQLAFIVDIGQNHDPKVPLAFDYLNYLGTEKMSPDEVKKEFFKLGINFNTYNSNDRCYIMVDGLEESFPDAVKLVENIIHNAKADTNTYAEFVKGQMKKRADNRLSKNNIKWGALYNFARYGEESPFNHDISNEEMQNLDPEELTKIIDDIFNYNHRVFYYGNKGMDKAEKIITEAHRIPESLEALPEPTEFTFKNTDDNSVYLFNYDMVQADIMMISKGVGFNTEIVPMARLFNEFYGSGLSSIVFQEIRESKGLAYSAYASYTTPGKKDEPHFLRAFVGSQPDKLKDAVSEMIKLMNNMPEAQKQFEGAKEAILNKIETERIIKTSIFWNYLSNEDRGIDYDMRKDIYNTVQNATLEDMKKFFKEYISDKKYTIVVMGNKEGISNETLSGFGEVKLLTKDQVFPY